MLVEVKLQTVRQTHISDGSDAVESRLLLCGCVTMVPNAQQVFVVTEVKVQLVAMAMSSYQMNDLKRSGTSLTHRQKVSLGSADFRSRLWSFIQRGALEFAPPPPENLKSRSASQIPPLPQILYETQ